MDCALFVEESRSGAETHMLISIAAAYLDGVFFMERRRAGYERVVRPSPVRLGVAAIAEAPAALLTSLLKRRNRPGRFK